MTLIEVIVALVLLSIVVVSHALLTLRFGQHQRTASLGAYRTAALTSAASKFTSIPYDSLPGRVGCQTFSVQPFAYQQCVTVTDVSSTQRKVQIVVAPTTMLKPDTLVISRAKNSISSPLGS